MVDFAKRPEITVGTMGKVHNPSGEGVAAISTQAKAKAARLSARETAEAEEDHETKTKQGTARRNITRKKSVEATHRMHKKQGGHGKGKWNEYDIQDVEVPLDEKDPLFDESTDTSKYILSSGQGVVAQVDPDKRGYDVHTNKAVHGPLLTNAEFKVRVAEALLEYFDSCDADEVIRSIDELGCQEYHDDIVKKVISVAMDKSSRERELTSRLLTCLHPHPMPNMERGFDLLLDSLDDLSCDVPEAKTMAACFLARAVVDEVLPPAYLSEQNNSRPGSVVVEKAVALLSREHCTARLEHVWGPGDGRDVPGLKQEIAIVVQEYLNSRELDEAARCIQELQAPHFHHELVKRGTFLAMELDGTGDAVSTTTTNLDAMAALLGFLVRNAIVSEFQVQKGLGRLNAALPDMQLDIPKAPELLKAFEGFCVEQGCLPGGPTTAADSDANSDGSGGDE